MFPFVVILTTFGIFALFMYCLIGYADRRTNVFPLWYCRLFKNKAALTKIVINSRRQDEIGAVALLTWQPKDCDHKITTKVRTSHRSSFHIHESEHDIDIKLDIPFRVQLGAWWHLNRELAIYDAKEQAKFYDMFATEKLDNSGK